MKQQNQKSSPQTQTQTLDGGSQINSESGEVAIISKGKPESRQSINLRKYQSQARDTNDAVEKSDMSMAIVAP